MKIIPSRRLVRSRLGLSLIEVQVAVAILALLAAIVVPQVPRFLAQATDAKGRVNAKNLASLGSAASAAGVEFVDLDSAIAQLVKPGGLKAQLGLQCAVPVLSAGEVEAAKQHLGFSNGRVTYEPH